LREPLARSGGSRTGKLSPQDIPPFITLLQSLAALRGHSSKREPVQAIATAETQSDFPTLAVTIRDAGLLERRRGYYTVKIALTVAGLAAGWLALVIVGDSWAVLGVAAFLGVVFTQLGFIGHDAGHQQVFKSRRANRILGLAVGNVLIGLSFGWWVPKHNAHHAHPNQVGRDPDIGEGFLRVSPGRLERVLQRMQAGLFFPLMLLRAVGLHVSGVQMLLRKRDRSAALEAILLTLHAAVYLSLVLLVLSPVKALVFIVLQQALFSLYLGCSFAPNHKGMPIIEDARGMSFAYRQVSTSRNVRGGPFTDLVLGGLNYQIEHHLFPTMPRPNLARAQSIVRSFCNENGLNYCEDSVIGSFGQILRYLRAEAESARA
jgi:fatty acid desaturase